MKRFMNCTFENYRVNANNKQALNEVKDFAENFDKYLEKGNNLILCGGVGTGKTHLSYALMKGIRDLKSKANEGVDDFNKELETKLGFKEKFDNWQEKEDFVTSFKEQRKWKTEYIIQRTTIMDILCEIKSTFGSSGTEEDVYARYRRPDLLIIDEVGVQYNKESERTMLYSIINGRYEAMKPTMIISNFDKKGLIDTLGLRIVDRLFHNGKYIFVKGESMRS